MFVSVLSLMGTHEAVYFYFFKMETHDRDADSYFGHYFREWAAKLSGVDIYRELLDDVKDEELLDEAIKALKKPVRSFAERVGNDHPDALDSAMTMFPKEIKVLDRMAREYNSTFRNFENTPDLDGIEEMCKAAYQIRDVTLDWNS